MALRACRKLMKAVVATRVQLDDENVEENDEDALMARQEPTGLLPSSAVPFRTHPQPSRAAPTTNYEELNYEERRMAMFLAFKAATARLQKPFLLTRLRGVDKDLVQRVVSFL